MVAKESHTLTKIVYKPDTQSTEEYIAVINPEEYKKWKEGDTTIALALVVDSFDIFHSNTGHTGKLGKASKQQLENVFGTSKEEDAMKILLEKGTEHAGKSFISGNVGQNAGRGSAGIDTRGKGTNGV